MNFDQKLKEKLKQNIEFWDEEIDDINRNEIIDRAYKVDKDLIGILIDDKEIRETFFDKIKEYWVFNVNKFVDYIENIKVLSNSYTKFKNKIGLTIDGKFLNERGEVSLVWPFKDCVLEGGMTKEDQKRNEIFFNEILAKDEIDRLFDAKVLTNFKKYTAKGEEKVKDFNRDEKGTIKDNLIIKGNNLLALHSLKKEFAGKVKLIYIDPPYNLGKGDFGYNDSFNHSTWLTFMKNRLEVAKKFLKDSGAIIVSCDDAEQAYLKILLDEVFKRNNFLVNGVVNRASEIASNYTISKHEYFIVYSKSFTNFTLEGEERFTTSRGTVGNENQTMPVITFPAGLKCIGVKDGTYKETRKIKGSSENIENLDPIVVENGKLKKEVRMKAKWRSSNDMRNFFENNCKPTVAKINGIIEKIYFEGDRFMPQIKKRIIEKIPSLILDNKRGSKDLDKLELKGKFKYPKSVDYIKKLISFITSKEDYILDFFAGSGSTAQAVMQLNELDGGNRKFILLEQLDKHMETCLARNKLVIQNSKDESFIYCELKKYNQEAIDKIQAAKDTKSLLKIWAEMVDKYFLNYDVEIKKFNDNQKIFKNLPLEKQKEVLIEMLNKNQLYVNFSEIEDSQFKISKEDKKLNKRFYNE